MVDGCNNLKRSFFRNRTQLGTGQHIVSESRIASLTTSSLPALEAYLEGEAAYRASDFPAAIQAYQRAVEEDSTFALALLRLSFAFAWEGGDDYIGSRGAVTNALDQAIRHVDRLPAREADLVRATRAYQNGDRAALRLARGAVRKYPDDPDMWSILGEDGGVDRSRYPSLWRLAQTPRGIATPTPSTPGPSVPCQPS